jgi:hypothetical protein
MNSFLSRDNVDMLIEILLEDKPSKTQADIQPIIQEINVFRNTLLNTSSANFGLLELNQLFLKRMVQNQPPHQQQHQPQAKYTVEDLKAERLDFFDQQVAQKRVEFESAITLKKPAVPEFGDKQTLDIPISDMDTLLAQTLAQRNMDIPFSTQQKPSDWLSPANTSVKSEKQVKLDITELSASFDKFPLDKFEDTTTNNTTNTTPLPSIFSKLKQTPSTESQIEALTNRIIALENKLMLINGWDMVNQ